MVFKRILVPIDDLELGQSSLDQVKRLLRREDATLILLHAVAPSHVSSLEGTTERHMSLRTEGARRKLAELSARLEADGITVTHKVVMGDPALVILAEAAHDISLVAMSTHGRRGPIRWLRGSVTERVLRHCPAPVLILNPARAGEQEHTRFRRILVPLDGSKRSAEILPLVADFARLHESDVTLLRVGRIITPAMEVPLAETVSLPDPRELEASLLPWQKQLMDAGVKKVEITTAMDASEAMAILDYAERARADLLAMCTHGWTGLDRWLYGSVAEKVLRGCPIPLLVNRVVKAEEKSWPVELAEARVKGA